MSWNCRILIVGNHKLIIVTLKRLSTKGSILYMTQKSSQKPTTEKTTDTASKEGTPIKLPVVIAGALTVCVLTGIFLSNLSIDTLPKPPNAVTNEDVFSSPAPQEPAPSSLEMEPPLTPKVPEDITYLNHMEQGGFFELPLRGASGLMGVNSELFQEMDGNIIRNLTSGEGFYVLQEEGDWWEIMLQDGTSGWVLWEHCLINLPDVVPSIVYDNPYASLCTSCSLGKDIPNVTGEKLYHCSFFNKRLNKEEYLTPVLYETAKKIQKLQQNALSDGYSLSIYEGFRPAKVQQQLVEGLSTLMAEDQEVNEALTSAPWNSAWFVNTGISSHQKGQAVDMTLVEVIETAVFYTGDYQYLGVIKHKELDMPTPFDELSPLSAVYSAPISTSDDRWKSTPFSDTMTESAILLHNYAIEVGFLPLASEWWHFTDPHGQDSKILGNFLPDDCYSIPPYEITAE